MISYPLKPMRKKILITLIILLLPACRQAGPGPAEPRRVLGVTLGGSAKELVAEYGARGLALDRAAEGRYVSASVLDPPPDLRIIGVEYQLTGGVLARIEVTVKGDAAGDLEQFLDKQYSYDTSQRVELEQRHRWIGNIGERDHYWSLQGMSIVVVGSEGSTRLVYLLKQTE